MPENTLTVNYQHVQDSAKVVPRSSHLSSQRACWQYIQLEHHIQPAFEMPEYRAAQNMIVLIERRQTAIVERRFEGKFQKENVSEGSAAIIPANMLHQVRWNGPVEFLVLALEPSWAADVAREFLHPDQVEIVPHFFQPDPLIHQIGIALKNVLQSNSDSRLYAESAAALLSAHLLQKYSSHRMQLPQQNSGLSLKQLRVVTDYIHDHLSQHLGLTELAKMLGFSAHHFARLFKASTGLPPHRYVLQARLQRAHELLSNTDLTIAQIAYGTGFANQSHLTYHFKRHYRVTPRQAREE